MILLMVLFVAETSGCLSIAKKADRTRIQPAAHCKNILFRL